MDVLRSAEIWILAGGASSRMGQDKKNLRHGGRTLLSWIQERATETGAPVRTVRSDLVAGCGPLGGVYTALKNSSRPWNFFLACDMPFVGRALLTRLALAIRPRDKGAFLSNRSQVGFPFLLHRDVGPRLDEWLQSGERSIQNLCRRLAGRVVEVPVSESAALLNINTPQDWQQAVRLWPQFFGVAPAVLDVAGLGVRRGGIEILRDIHWRVASGQHWVILGANGSGKSSLLCALTGYLSPSSGYIWLLGKFFGRCDWRELRKKIGLVSSALGKLMADPEPALAAVLSGRSAVIDYWGKPAAAEKTAAERVLRQVECWRLRDRPWLVLSQGERQRVLIGRALMARPRILILDEPCAGLDPAAREHFLQFIERLGKKRGAPTLVLVTHHVEEIMPVFSHALILKEGEVLASGPKEAVLKSSQLSDAFSARAQLRAIGARYQLEISPSKGKTL